MFSTCLYCSSDFGRNDALETLAIGRRIAFDSLTGRLWVICRRCDKWNLVPFDSRLESIDTCEWFFRDAKLRFSTDNIGIARLDEGLELVRIGRPERSEYAAWRYGSVFGRRRRRTVVTWIGGPVLLSGAAMLTAYFLGAIGGSTWVAGAGIMGTMGLVQVPGLARSVYRHRRVAAHVADVDGTAAVMTAPQLDEARFNIDRTGTFTMQLPTYDGARAGFVRGFTKQYLTYRNDQALAPLGRVLPRVNLTIGNARNVQDAVSLLDEHRSLAALLWVRKQGAPRRFDFSGIPEAYSPDTKYPLNQIVDASRLAIEMLAHEESERAALAGELKLLERQWRDADAVAKVADGLVLGEDIRSS